MWPSHGMPTIRSKLSSQQILCQSLLLLCIPMEEIILSSTLAMLIPNGLVATLVWCRILCRVLSVEVRVLGSFAPPQDRTRATCTVGGSVSPQTKGLVENLRFSVFGWSWVGFNWSVVTVMIIGRIVMMQMCGSHNIWIRRALFLRKKMYCSLFNTFKTGKLRTSYTLCYSILLSQTEILHS